MKIDSYYFLSHATFHFNFVHDKIHVKYILYASDDDID